MKRIDYKTVWLIFFESKSQRIIFLMIYFTYSFIIYLKSFSSSQIYIFPVVKTYVYVWLSLNV